MTREALERSFQIGHTLPPGAWLRQFDQAESFSARDSPGSISDADALNDRRSLVETQLERVIVRERELVIVPKLRAESETRPPSITVPWTRPIRARKRDVILPIGADQREVTPIRAEARARLIAAIARARAWVAELTSDPVATTATIAVRENLSERSVRMTLPLAFLAPDLVKATIDGTLPFGAGVTALAELPLCWLEQAQSVAAAGRADLRRRRA